MVADTHRHDAEITDPRASEALAAHDRGWCVTPLEGKKPRLRAWQTLAPPHRGLAQTWATEGNVGVRTGRVSGVIVLDVDAPELPNELASIVTPMVRTGKGGIHVYVAAPSGPVRNSVKSIHPSVDVRGDGGQVVLAGGIHPETGARYEWLSGRSVSDVPLLPFDALPEAWRATMLASHPEPKPESAKAVPLHTDRFTPTATPRARAALAGETDVVARALEGQRNHTLNRAAFNLGTLIGAGELTRNDTEQALSSAARVCGLPDDEARATIRSGLDAGERHPRPPVDRFKGVQDASTLRAPDRAKALNFLRRALPGVPVARIVKRGGDRADFDLLTTDGRAVQLGDARAVLDPLRVQAAIADVLGIVIRTRTRKDWRPVAQALFDLAEVSDRSDTEANQTRAWIVATEGIDRYRIDLSNAAELARWLKGGRFEPAIARGSDQRLYIRISGMVAALRHEMGIIIAEHQLRRRLGRLGFEAHQLSARAGDRVLKGRFHRSPMMFDPEDEPSEQGVLP